MAKYALVALGPYNVPARILGGVKPSLPIYQRQPKAVLVNGYCIDALGPHEPGNFHFAHRTRMPQLSWAICRIRRARLGQLSLFGGLHG